jgi:hypothetical protein
MVRESGKIVRVVVPASKEVAKSTSDAWKLELKPGWKVVVAGQAGDQTLKQE